MAVSFAHRMEELKASEIREILKITQQPHIESDQYANKYEVPVIEDNPYGELRFEGIPLPSLKALDKKGLVMFLGTFSKTFCPGLRIGWAAADQSVLEKYILLKQSADLQTSTIAQREVAKFLEMFNLDEHVKENTFRLNYSNMPEDKIVEVIKRLANVLKQYSKG